MKTKENELNGTATTEQLNKWKAKHSEIYKLSVEDSNGETHVCYVRKPDRKTVEYAYSNAPNQIKINSALFNSCWLGGSEDIKTNDEMFFSVSAKMGGLLEIKEAELEKL